MRVFVAGATGAIGRPLIPRLIAAGHTVTAMTRRRDKLDALQSAGADAVVCDVFDANRLTSVVQKAAPQAIIHQLTDLPATMNPWRLRQIYERNNRVRREGTRNLIAAADQANVGRMIVQSMATWYQPVGGALKSEADPLWTDAPEPIGAAVRTVATMEHDVVRDVAIGVILRYGAFYGPGTWYARDGEIARLVRARRFPIVGSGSGVTSFIHVDDAAAATVAALAATASGIYNIVDDVPAAASEWLLAYADALGAPPPKRVPEFIARLALGKALTAWITTMRGASNRAATISLGWRPFYTSFVTAECGMRNAE